MRALISTVMILGVAATAAAQGGQTSEQTSQQTTTQTTTQKPPKDLGNYYFQALDARGPLQFEIALRRYSADGTMSGLAGDSATEGEFQSYVWLSPSLCGLSASDEEPTNVGGAGWHFKGAVVSRTGEQMSVRIDWNRMWENGKKITNGPSGTSTVTLRSGEKLELDRVVPSGASSCGAAEAKLEASIVSKPALRLTPFQSAGRGGGVAAAGRGAGAPGRGAATGSGTGTTTSTTGTTGTAAAGRGQIGAGRGADSKFWREGPAWALQSGKSYVAELWLVHRRPDGTEAVQQQTVRFSGGPLDVKFPPVSVESARGAIAVDITGKLQAIVGDPPEGASEWYSSYLIVGYRTDPNAAKQPERVMLTIARRARASGGPILDTTGSSVVLLDIPKPEDVLSFEFPPLQKATEDLLKGHTFSLRVRIAAVK